MTAEPKIQPLSYNNRTLVFILMCVVFLVLMPIFVFYATGYRIDFSGDERNIVSVGGIYINSDQDNTEILIDEKPVEQMRIFRSAAYIQNLPSGIHQIQVRGEGLHTWVKELPVHDFLVTEANSFSMPVVPQMRVVPEYESNNGFGVVVTLDKTASTSQDFFPHASTTTLVLATTTAAAKKLEIAPEFEFVESLFASSSKRAVDRSLAEEVAFRFNDLTGARSLNTLATSTKESGDIVLYEEEGEVYARWVGELNRAPYYYCVNYLSAPNLISDYGEHVYESLLENQPEEILLAEQTAGYDKICRDTIRIDRKWQTVKWFEFVPGNNNLILMLLEDGLYMVEIDDRGWQNTQLLYPGDTLEFLVNSSQIYLYDGQYYLELFTEVAS